MSAFRRRRLVAFVLVLGFAITAMCAVPASSLAMMPAPEWAQQTLASGPSGRDGASMAFDPAIERIVLFGGYAESGFNSETWTYNGSTWEKPSASGPSARVDASMAYDPATGRLVLFGGDTASGPSSETWTYNGSTWEESSASGPSARYGASMAFDPATGRLVLFGGYNYNASTSFSSETWTYNGSTWEESSASGPSARYGASMAFDPATGRLVLFGGETASGRSSETWTYDGSTWEESSASGPSARSGASMAFDPAIGRLVLFGGYLGSGFSGETWTYDGSTWEQSSASGPSARDYPSMAYDPATGRIVLFGGHAEGAPFISQTWTYGFPAGTEKRWGQQTPAESPPGREEASMAYDPAIGRIVLFGGRTGSGLSGETWTYNGSTWEKSSVNGPPARVYASMVYDPATGRIVLFGGATASGLSSETWTYNGSTWEESSVSGGPSARVVASMAYDPATGRVVLFGGETATGFSSETWTYDGSTWEESSVSGGPSARGQASMAYDPATGRVVLFGGSAYSGNHGETWTFDGSAWEESSASGPPARSAASMAFDPATGRLVLFGGNTESEIYSSETWTYDGSEWEKSSASGPSGREGASMAFDPATGQLVLFGGYGESRYNSETWTYAPFVKASPSISTSASAGVVVGGKVSDQATLGGGESPSGTIVFKLYGPGDSTCTATPVYTSSAVSVSGDGKYESGEYVPAEEGAYRWIASYSGDTNNEAVLGSCGEAGETVSVSKAAPSLSTSASAGVALGGKISDEAVLTGGYSPGGSITFKVYKPGDTTCAATPVYTSAAVSVKGNGRYDSGEYVPTEAGTYRWIASYSGDSNNEAVHGSCGEAGETVAIGKDSQSIVFPVLAGHVLGEPDFALSASASSGLPVSFASATTSICTISGGSVHLVAAGTCTIVASQAGDADYQAAPVVQRSFAVAAPAQPVITSNPTPAVSSTKPPASCRRIRVRMSNYTPRRPKTLHGKVRFLGLGARLSVGVAVRMELKLTLIYRRHGRTHRVRLGKRRINVKHRSDLRLRLPARLRKLLHAGSHVTLAIGIRAVAKKGVTGCRSVYSKRVALHTHIVTLDQPRQHHQHHHGRRQHQHRHH